MVRILGAHVDSVLVLDSQCREAQHGFPRSFSVQYGKAANLYISSPSTGFIYSQPLIELIGCQIDLGCHGEISGLDGFAGSFARLHVRLYISHALSLMCTGLDLPPSTSSRTYIILRPDLSKIS